MNNKNIIKKDCLHFIGDRPCVYHKEKGMKCYNCKFYSKTGKRILISKLGAMGDVLRTTFLLNSLKSKYKNCHITWIVDKNSYEVLRDNHLIDRILTLDDNLFLCLSVCSFDMVVNLDLSVESLLIATYVKAHEKYGFIYNTKGLIKPLNRTAVDWLSMSVFDDLKKNNKLTYQELASNTCNMKFNNEKIIVNLTEESLKFREKFKNKYKLKDKRIIGLNIGSGKRWLTKRWHYPHWKELAKLLKENGFEVMLFGGYDEADIVHKISKGVKLINTGTDNTINVFFGLLSLVDVLVTGDTMALHAALGLNKKVVALFGPTSSNEIELYGLGEKIIAPVGCTVCYKNKCDKECIDLIKEEDVLNVILKVYG